MLRKAIEAGQFWLVGRHWPKVFGVGLSKTGTTSLGYALEILGYKRKTHRTDLLHEHLAGNTTAVLRRTKHSNAFEDFPWSLIYRQAYELYGERSRFILTRRASPEIWLESFKAHALRTPPGPSSRSLVFGHDYPQVREQEYLDFYQRHNDEVRAFFRDKPGMFTEFCWENGDGWDQLCGFLGRPVPAVPFPHGNSRFRDAYNPERHAANLRRIEQQMDELNRG